MRVLKSLIGVENGAGPTLASLGENFGLAGLIGKSVAIIADARLGGADQRMLSERLLAISGEDMQTVDRKYKEAWTGTFPTRFVIVTNELPKFNDASGALPSRLLPIILTRSFLGKEDTQLSDRLLAELPGIFLWALDGVDRLQTRGRFEMPVSSEEAMQDLKDLASPVAAFIRDRCEIGVGFSVACDLLYGVWREWCEHKGVLYPGSAPTFGRDMAATLPGLSKAQFTIKGARAWHYVGIKLCKEAGT